MAQIQSTQYLNQPSDLSPIPAIGAGTLLYGLDVYNGMLYTLLMTTQGTRPFFPEYGIGVPSWLFVPLDIHSRADYSHIIRTQIARWIPQITVKFVQLAYDPIINALTVDISYNITINGLVSGGRFSNIVLQAQ